MVIDSGGDQANDFYPNELQLVDYQIYTNWGLRIVVIQKDF